MSPRPAFPFGLSRAAGSSLPSAAAPTGRTGSRSGQPRRWVLLAGLTVLAPLLAVAAPGLDTLEPRPREMLRASMDFADRYWDEAASLLHSPAPDEAGLHRIRESSWYALGLFLRHQPGDDARAVRILRQILDRQYAAPGQPWDGTFQRTPEEPVPQPGAKLWRDYDPNWRQFIGITFALILTEYESRLPADLPPRLRESIRRAVEGELTQGRAEPYHTNIALLHIFLLGWAGRQLGHPDWVAQSEAAAEKISIEFARHGTFDEYNSPTYYGVDLYGLALWRRYGATEKVRAWGAGMEAGLWREIGRFYHAGLRNLCGPYDRTYGLDMGRTVSLTGVWMGLVLDRALTPLPATDRPMDHGHDFVFTPAFVLLGTQIPAEVLPGLRNFQGERRLERVIDPERTATAWLGRDLMLGGESTRGTRDAGPHSRFGQFIPATAHWRVGAAGLGWLALGECPPVDAGAGPDRLDISTARGDSTFRICAPGLDVTKLTPRRWSLPNLEVQIETDATGFTVVPETGSANVTYHGATRLILRTAHHP